MRSQRPSQQLRAIKLLLALHLVAAMLPSRQCKCLLLQQLRPLHRACTQTVLQPGQPRQPDLLQGSSRGCLPQSALRHLLRHRRWSGRLNLGRGSSSSRELLLPCPCLLQGLAPQAVGQLVRGPWELVLLRPCP